MNRAMVFVSAIFVCGVASAQTYLPSMKTIQGTRIAPASAATYYAPSTSHSNGLGVTDRSLEVKELARGLGAAQIPAQLTQSAYAQRAFEYVRQNIRTVPMFGTQKGAKGAIIDQSGTAFDQATLLVELLREAQITANYQIGTVTLTGAQYTANTGITSAAAACQILANGGIPVRVNSQTAAGCSVSNPLNTVQFTHIWVVAPILNLAFDPSYKTITTSTGVPLPVSLNCGTASAPTCASTAIAAARPTASADRAAIGGAPAWRNVRYDNLGTTLNTYAQSFKTYLESNLPNALIESVLPLSNIDIATLETPAGTLSYADSGSVSWTEIPDLYRATLRVQFDNINYLLYADEIAGQRLKIYGRFEPTQGAANGPREAGLYLEYRLLARSTRPTYTIGDDTLTLTANHPYAASSGAYADETVPFKTYAQISFGTPQWFQPMAIVHAWGETGPGTNAHFSRLATRNFISLNLVDPGNPDHIVKISAGGGTYLCGARSTAPTLKTRFISGGDIVSTHPDCLGLPLHGVAANWQVQDSRISELVGAVNGVRIQNHHALGWVTGADSTGTSMSVEYTRSIQSATSVTSDRKIAMLSLAALSSRLEGSIAEQTAAIWEGVSGISMLKRANQNSIALMQLSSSTWSGANGSLQNYPAALKTQLQQQVASPNNYTFILPRNWNFGTYFGALTFNFGAFGGDNSTGEKVSYIVGAEGLKGSSAVGSEDPLGEAIKSAAVRESTARSRKSYGVDLVSGALRLSPDADLVTGVGQFPSALEFRRNFDSSMNPAPQIFGWCEDLDLGGSLSCFSDAPSLADGANLSLGNGWKHNLEVLADIASEPLQAMGEDSALDAASTVAALFTLRDLYTGTLNLDRRITALFVTDWWAMTLADNAVVVRTMGESKTFMRLPGSQTAFNPPPGSADVLVQAGVKQGPLILGSAVEYLYHPLTLTLHRGDGSTITFDPAHEVADTNPNPEAQKAAFGKRLFVGSLWTFPAGIQVKFEYGAQPLTETACLRTVTNSFGRSLTFTIDTLAFHGCRLTRVEDETGRFVEWNAAETLPGDSTITRFDGSWVRYHQNALPWTSPYAGFLLDSITTATDTNNPWMQFEWDGLNRVSRSIDAGANAVSYYPASVSAERLKRGESLEGPLGNVRNTNLANLHGQITQQIDPLNRSTWRFYDSQRRIKRIVKAELDETVYDYDSRSNEKETREKAKPGSGLPDIVKTTTFLTSCDVAVRKDCNKPQSQTDARSNLTTYDWNQTTGQLRSITGPTIDEGTPFTEFTYTPYAVGAPLNSTVSLLTAKRERITASPLRETTTQLGYNETNKYVLRDATLDFGGLNLKTALNYNALGDVTSIDGPRPGAADTTNYTYDKSRQLTRIVRPLNAVERFTYDHDGLLMSQRKALVVAPTDATPTNPRPSDLIASQWKNELRSYYGSGDLRTKTDAEGYVTTYAYDFAGRLEYETVPVTDSQNRVTRTVYDAAGQEIEKYLGWGSSDQIRYSRQGFTPNGKLDWVEDGVKSPTAGELTTTPGNRTDLVYDAYDRPYRMVLPHPDTGLPSTACDAQPASCTLADFEQYGYNADGHRTSLRNRANATLTYDYNALGKERLRSIPANTANPGGRIVNTGFDLTGRVVSITAEGQTLTKVFDNAGRADYETDSYLGVNNKLDYTFDEAGNRTRLDYPGGGFARYEFDNLNRIRDVFDASGLTLAHYDYDLLSRVDLVTYANGAISDPAYYPDDALSGLTQSIPSRSMSFSYGRNRQNQITNLAVSVPSPATLWTENDFMWSPSTTSVRSYVPNKLNQYKTIDGGTLGYDLNGNLISDGTWTLGYDNENRMRTANRTGRSVVYEYDPIGRRRAKIVDVTNKTIYVSDGAEEIEERSGTNVVIRSYVNAANTDDRISMLDNAQCGTGGHCFYQVNHQGSTIAFTNQQGQVLQTYSYDAYGNSNVSASGNPFRYTGRRFDEETGLYYYRARYYSPTHGRYLQTDPLGYKDNLNLYAYVGNDPVNNVDPTGMFTCTTYPDGSQKCWSRPNHLDRAFLSIYGWYHAIKNALSQSSESSTESEESEDEEEEEEDKEKETQEDDAEDDMEDDEYSEEDFTRTRDRNTDRVRPSRENSDRGDKKTSKEAKDAYRNDKDGFRRWFHKKLNEDQKMSGGSNNPDLDLEEGYQQWLGEGRPTVD